MFLEPKFSSHRGRMFNEWCKKGIMVDFKSLKETCWRSRYFDYKFQEKDAQKPLKQLDKTKKEN